MYRKDIIGLSEACLGREEEEALTGVIRSGWLSQGEKVEQFEMAFSKMTELNAVAVTNCTAGLHLVLSGLGIGSGDEVLVPGVTFVATVNAVIYTGARPVPVDIQDGIPHMSMEAAEAALTSRTRAVVIMHYGGYSMDIPAWRCFAEEHGLLLVEDAAHCPGLPGVGEMSDAAVLSFFANKNMTTAEGGMILTSNGILAERLRRLRGHGMTTGTLSRAAGHAYTYDVDMLGWNYRMDELRAAVGLVQLSKLPRYNARRRELMRHYITELRRRTPWVQLPFFDDWPTVAHIMAILLPEGLNREWLMQELRGAGIQTSIHYPMFHRFTWHKRLFADISLPRTENWCSRTLTLPLHPFLSDKDVDYVVATLGKLWEERGISTAEGALSGRG